MPDEALNEDRVDQLLEFYALRHFSAEAARNLVRSSFGRSFLTIGRITEAEELEAWTRFQVGVELRRRLVEGDCEVVETKATAKAAPPVLPAWSESLGDGRQLSRRSKPVAQESSSQPAAVGKTSSIATALRSMVDKADGERAVENYGKFHRIPAEQVTIDQVQQSSAGIEGWANMKQPQASQESSDPLFSSDPWSSGAPRGPPPCRLGPPPVPPKNAKASQESSDPLFSSDPWSSGAPRGPPPCHSGPPPVPPKNAKASGDLLFGNDPWSSTCKSTAASASEATSSKPLPVGKASQVAPSARRMLDTAMRSTQRSVADSSSASRPEATRISHRPVVEEASHFRQEASASSAARSPETESNMTKLKAYLEIGDFDRKVAFLRKCIQNGQRIEGFELEAWMLEEAIEEVKKAKTSDEAQADATAEEEKRLRAARKAEEERVAEEAAAAKGTDRSAWNSGAGAWWSSNDWSSSSWSWNARDNDSWDDHNAEQETDVGDKKELETKVEDPIVPEEATIAKLVEFLSTHQDPEKAKMLMRSPKSGVSLSAVAIAVQRFEAKCRAQAFGPYQ